MGDDSVSSNLNEHFPRVVLVTLNWNGRSDTLECLASLKMLSYANYEIVVVDNGSTDNSVAAFRSQHPDVTVIENGRNLGYAAGFNAGLGYAYEQGADYFLVLNNDTVIDPGALGELVKVAQRDKRIGFVSGKVYSYTKPDTFQTAGCRNDPVTLIGRHVASGEVDRGQNDEVKDYDFVDDVFLLVRRQAYETVGGYYPPFYLYGEIPDWCARIRRAGFRIVYAPAARIWHKGNLGNEGITFSPKRIFYFQRHRILFIWRNGSRKQFAVYLRHLMGELPLRTARYAKHGRLREMLAYHRGIASGLLLVWRNRRVTDSLAGRTR